MSSGDRMMLSAGLRTVLQTPVDRSLIVSELRLDTVERVRSSVEMGVVS